MCCLVWKLFLIFINVFAWNVNCLLFIHVLSGVEIVSVFINVIACSGNRFVFLLILLRFSSSNMSLLMKFGNSEDGNSSSEDDEAPLPTYECVICHRTITNSFSQTAAPVADGPCCFDCLLSVVSPARSQAVHQPARHPMQINIKTLAGKTITLRVLPSDTIDNIKDQIEDKKDIPTFQQHLFLSGFELQNGHTLLDYNIQNDATLNFIWRGFGSGT